MFVFLFILLCGVMLGGGGAISAAIDSAVPFVVALNVLVIMCLGAWTADSPRANAISSCVWGLIAGIVVLASKNVALYCIFLAGVGALKTFFVWNDDLYDMTIVEEFVVDNILYRFEDSSVAHLLRIIIMLIGMFIYIAIGYFGYFWLHPVGAFLPLAVLLYRWLIVHLKTS